MRCATGPADGREPQPASQIVDRGTEPDLGTLGPDRLSGQVDEEQPRIGTVGKANVSGCAQAKGMPAVDPLESVALRPAMGECGEDQDARHEAERAGRKRVRRLERMHDLRWTHRHHQRQHLTTQR